MTTGEVLPPCPVCGEAAVPELCDPAGVALCLRCGSLFRRVQGRLAQLFGAPPNEIVLRSRLVREVRQLRDLGADSLDIVELVMELEEEFGVAVLPEMLKDATVADLLRLLRQLEEDDAHVA